MSYFCPFCNVLLRKASYKQRKIHNKGKNHLLMRKAYYLEVLENKDIRKKLLEKIIHINYSTFKLPPGFESKKILPFIPKMPFTPFKIPPGFNFEDRRNYPKDMKDIKRILDGEYF